ncbi:MAG: PAS domain-containing protein [Chloroflexaceae bacterium]|nr:PAS domain-containing protein [Chloroflexaceae bacterium]
MMASPPDHGEALQTLQEELARLRQHTTILERECSMFRTLVEHAPCGIAAHNPDGTIIYANRSYHTLLGIENAVGQPIESTVGQTMEKSACLPDVPEGAGEDGMCYEKVAYHRGDGSIFPAQVSRISFYDPQRMPEGGAVFVRDISEQVHIEQTFRETQTMLQGLLRHMPAAVFVKSLDRRFLLVNEYAAQVMQQPMDWITGRPDHEVVALPFLERWHANEDRVIATGQPSETEEVFSFQGEEMVQHTLTFPIYDNAGTLYAIGGFAIDVTERRRFERDLQRSTALLQGIIDNVPSLIYVKDPDGRFMVVNRTAATIMGLEPGQIIGRLQKELSPPDLAEQWHAIDRHIIETGTVLEREEEVPLADGIHTYLTINFPVSNEAGAVYAAGGITTDITRFKQAERERTALQEQVIEAQRAALRELSTPLIPIDDQVVIMPLIGTIDSSRAQQVLETLLSGVEAHRAHIAILDITGVQLVDTQVANALIHAARAVQLLGSQVMLTGIQPSIAQTLVQLDVDMHGILTHSSLQSGIAYAQRKRRRSES